MALTLANSIDAADLELEVNGTVPAVIDIGYRFRLDDELLEIRVFGRSTVTVLGGAATESIRNRNQWIVSRGLEATTWASHTSGASILGTLPAVAVAASEVLPAPFAEGGGGVTEEQFDAHTDDTTAVHGIADTGALLTGWPLEVPAEGQFTGPNGSTITFVADGMVAMQAGGAQVAISPDGTVQLIGATLGVVTLASNGTIELAGATGVTVVLPFDGGLVITGLPTADPVVAGALYVNAGVLMVSEG